MRHPGHVARLCPVGKIGGLLGCLEFGVGGPVGVDLVPKQLGLAIGFFLRDTAALVFQHDPPRRHGEQQRQHHEGFEKCAGQCIAGFSIGQQRGLAEIHQRQCDGQQQQQRREHREIVPDPPVQMPCQRLRQQAHEACVNLRGYLGVGFAAVVAACIERATQ